MPVRSARMTALLAFILGGCDRSGHAPLSAAAVVGCYQFAGRDGQALRSGSGFWIAPVRLDTVLAPVDGDGGYTTQPGYYSATPTAQIAEPNAIDTALFRATWQLLPPDTLLVMRSTGLHGQSISLQPRGRDFAGVEQWFNDVVDSTRSPSMDSVLARRVDCPKGD